MKTRLFTNARIIDPASNTDIAGSVLVKGTKIVNLGPDMPADGADEVIDCGGRILVPGIIDMRCHTYEKKAALAGGITTIALHLLSTSAPNTKNGPKITELKQAFMMDRDAPHGAACVQTSGPLITIGDGMVGIREDDLMERLVCHAAENDQLLINFPGAFDPGLAFNSALSLRLGLSGINNHGEAEMIERDIALAKKHNARIHIPLVSARESVDLIRAAKADGVRISAATAPQYLYLNENEIEGYNTYGKYTPPLRSEEDRLALIDAVEDGTIDTLVSDHSPCEIKEKRTTFADATPGATGFETLLPLVLSFVHSGKIPLMTALKALTITPAKHLGLDAGHLSLGAPADFMIFDFERPHLLKAEDLYTKGCNLVQPKLLLQGKVWHSVIDGQTVYEAKA